MGIDTAKELRDKVDQYKIRLANQLHFVLQLEQPIRGHCNYHFKRLDQAEGFKDWIYEVFGVESAIDEIFDNHLDEVNSYAVCIGQ